jgi:uncharacterized protein YkwD
MRRILSLTLIACGPAYSQQAQPGPQVVQGPPGGAADPTGPPLGGGAQVPPGDPWDQQASSPAGARSPSAPVGHQPAGHSVAERFVAAHASARAKHCAGPLTWSPKLATYAQKWADTLKSKGCVFGHSGGRYGENLAAGTEGVLDPEATVAMWYDEVKQYRFPDGGFSMKTGHFTQLVWRTTSQVGCGHAQCNGNDIWVCEYDPPGNYDGEYRANVLPTGCR